MPDYVLHAIVLASDSQSRQRAQLQTRLASMGLLDEATGSVESLSAQPGQQRFEGTIKGRYAQKVADELTELSRASGSGFGAVALYRRDGQPADVNGYYSLERADVAPADPHEERVQQAQLQLERADTIGSAWRSTETTLTTVTNDFGNDQATTIGCPAPARKVRWLHPTTHAVEDSTVQSTRAGEFVDVDRVDPTEPSWDTDAHPPTLIYELDYAEEGKASASVWDTRGEASKTDADDVVQWQAVYDTAHDLAGGDPILLDNGILRLEFDEANNALSAERWDDGSSSWSAVSLGSSDWELFDVDLRHVAPSRVDASVEFRDPTASPTDYYTLSLRFALGSEDGLWVRPESASSSTPSGLQTLLDPIASESITDPRETRGLVSRSEVGG